MATPRIIRDTLFLEKSQVTINEDASTGRFVVRGRFQLCDEKNGNGRIYERKIWEKVLGDKGLMERVQSRGMLGEVEHPSDGVTNLGRVSHIITHLSLEKNGELIGEAEILDTPMGNTMRALFRAGCRVGISSRGKGTSRMEGGIEYVNDDYQLDTFDFVENPSTPGAHPQLVSESKHGTEPHMDPKQLINNITAKLRDIRKLAESASPSERQRYAEEVLDLQMQLSTRMNEDAALREPGQDLSAELRKLRIDLLKEQPAVKQESVMNTTPRMPKPKGERAKSDTVASKAKAVGGKKSKKKEKDEAALYDGDDDMPMDDEPLADDDFPMDDEPGDEPGDEPMGDEPVGPDGPEDGEITQQDLDDFLKGDIDKLSKESLVSKLKKAIALGEVLVRRNEELVKSNRTLRERYEHAINSTVKMVEQKRALAVKEHVVGLVGRNPALAAHAPALMTESTVEAVDRKVQSLRRQKPLDESRRPGRNRAHRSELPFEGVPTSDAAAQIQETNRGTRKPATSQPESAQKPQTSELDESLGIANRILARGGMQ